MNPTIHLSLNKVWGFGMAGEMHAIDKWDTETSALSTFLDDPAWGHPKLVSTTHVLHLKIFVLPLLIVVDIPLWMTEDES